MRCSGLVHAKPPAEPLRSRFPHVAITLAAHAAFVVAAVTLTLPRVEQPTAQADTALVYLPSPPAARAELMSMPPPLAIQGLADVKGFKTVTPPIEVPQGIAPASQASEFDPRQFSGLGAEGGDFLGSAGGVLGGEGDDPNYIWPSIALLDEPPVLIWSPPKVYPAALQNLGVEGHVVLQFVIDTLGLAEPLSVHIVRATHPGFIDSARELVCKSRYRPGRMRGLPVRVRSVVRIEFTLTH
jgi:TonB family protein